MRNAYYPERMRYAYYDRMRYAYYERMRIMRIMSIMKDMRIMSVCDMRIMMSVRETAYDRTSKTLMIVRVYYRTRNVFRLDYI